MRLYQQYRNHNVALWLLVLLLLLASEARTQTQTVTIIDGPGAGTVLNVTPVTPTPQDPFVLGTVNSGAGTVGLIEDHPGVGLHYHGTLDGRPDPNATGAGWGHVIFNTGGGGSPSSVFNFAEQFGVAGNVPGVSPDGTILWDDLDGGVFIDPADPNNIWTFNADPTAPGGGTWTAGPANGADPFTIDDEEFQEQLGGIGSVLIADNSSNGNPPPAGNPPAGNPPAGNPPTPPTPTGPWTPEQGVPTTQQLNDEWQELRNMYDGYIKAKEYADKHPENKLAQENARGLLDQLGQQANKVAIMQTKWAIHIGQSAAAANNTPQPTTPGNKAGGTSGGTGGSTPGGTSAGTGGSTGGIVAPPNNTALNGQPTRPDQLATVQAIAAQFKGTRDLAGAAQAVFDNIGTSFVWSNAGDYMNGARTQDALFSARQMACFEFVHWIAHLCGPQRTMESSGAPFAGSSAAGVKSLQNTVWDRSSVIPAGKIVVGVARAFNNNAGYYHVGISLGNGKVISLSGDTNLHIENTADLFPRWAYSEVQLHDYNFFQQQGDKSQQPAEK